ncbi:MAG: hypothetical protein R2725_10235 [Solirubrobacterales bacterium]
MRRVLAVSAVLVAAAAIAGCGGEGAEDGALVDVYVSAGLCAEARSELARAGGEAGSLRVRAVCLAAERRDGRLDLATVGANARRASEDSTAVAYLLPRDPEVARFATPILAAAEIPWITARSGETAMSRTLRAIESAANTSSSLRSAVSESLEPG